MMRKLKNGEPVFHKHECTEERKGKVMSAEELHDFAVQILMAEYEETNANVIKYDKKADNEADFCFVNTGKKPGFMGGDSDEKAVNVLVVYNDSPGIDISDIDTSWMIEEYHRTGAIPRVTIASAWCISDESENGSPAVCGGDFCFKYYSISLIPNEKNEPLEKHLSDVELAVKYAESWKNLDESIVAPYLDKDFHYGSDWVFDEMPSRYEYLDYFKGKLATIRRTGSNIKIAIGRDHQTGDVAVLLLQNGNSMALVLTTKEGRITSAQMKDYERRFKVFNPEDELYQNHGDHLDCIMPANDLIQNHLQGIIQDSKAWRACDTKVTTDDMYEQKTGVYSLLYGENDIQMLATIAVSKKTHNNLFMSTYPIAKGVPVEVKIDKVIEWDNQVEATILCSIGEFDFAFFAIDYYCNKEKYQVGETISVDLASLGMKVEEAQRGFQFEGQQAIDWLAKIGKEPTYDENGNVEPVKFSMEKLVAFFNKNSKCPDEAEFQSPVNGLETTSIMNVDFFKTNILICRRDTEDGELEVSIPLYFRQDFFPEVKDEDPIRGWLWITGSITGEHNSSNFDSYKRPLGDIASEFEEYMDNQNFRSFDNLMPILDKLPLLKIREGYEFDAFQRGDDYGWVLQAYCCKEGANVHYVPSEHGDYDDSLRIHGRISWSEAECVPEALSYFEVPFTEVGIMQAWLMNNITDFMPKGWHSNYGLKHFIFETECIDKLFPKFVGEAKGLSGSLTRDRQEVRNKVLALDIESLLPTITINGDSAIMEYAYWNDWRGMVRVRTEVIKEGNSVRFLESGSEVLVEYSCGIRF